MTRQARWLPFVAEMGLNSPTDVHVPGSPAHICLATRENDAYKHVACCVLATKLNTRRASGW